MRARPDTAAGQAGPRRGLGGLLSRHPFWITFLTCLAVLVLRDPMSALYPPVLLEDAVEMLSFYHGNADPTRIFRFYNGYTSIGPNIVGYLAGLLPVRMAPYMLYGVPIALAAATFSAIQLRDVTFFGLTAGERYVICVGLCLLPLGNWALVANTTYMLWHLLILSAILLVFWRPGPPGPYRAAVFAFLLVASWSHPLFPGLLPLLAVRLVTAPDRAARAWFAVVGLAALAYPVFGVDIAGRPADVDPVTPAALVRDSAALFFARAMAEPVLSSTLRAALADRGLFALVVAVGVALFALLAMAVLRRRHQVARADFWRMAALVLLAGAFTAGAVLSDKALFLAPWGQRYTYPAAMLMGLLGGWALVQHLSGRMPRGRRTAGALLAAWVAVLVVLDGGYYRPDPADGRALHAFLQAVQRDDDAGRPGCRKLDRGRWSVVLDRPDPAQAADCPR